MVRDGLTNSDPEQAMWVLGDEHAWEISMCKCPEVGAHLRSGKENLGNRVNKRKWGANKEQIVWGLICNSEYPNFPSALSDMSSKLLWSHFSAASWFHTLLSSVTPWISSHSLDGSG